ncbi:MAG: tRNA (guanosine(37)-N1)-methyltransferase TrmD [Candidatus Brocadiia bacterium]
MRIDVLSLFPEVFKPLLQTSILGIARENNLVEYELHDIRDYSRDKHKKVDERPYGGGPGMVLRCEPVFRACEAVRDMSATPGRLILLTPQGKTFNQSMADEFARDKRLILLCGRYEGFDERIRRGLPVEEVSIGDYVLTGGEVAAMVVIDTVVRLVPGVLGHDDSTDEESFTENLLEYPQYTRPAEFRGMEVPDVLQSGNHQKIAQWRRQQALRRTKKRRADLLKNSETEQDDERTE